MSLLKTAGLRFVSSSLEQASNGEKRDEPDRVAMFVGFAVEQYCRLGVLESERLRRWERGWRHAVP